MERSNDFGGAGGFGFRRRALTIRTGAASVFMRTTIGASMTQVFEAEATVEKWDTDYYTPISLKFYDRAVSDMIAAMAVPAGAEVLDAGCGPGVHSIRVASQGYKVHAIDISETMLKHAMERVEAAGLSGSVRFSQMDLTHLDLANGSVPHAFSWGVIIHIPNALQAFTELARVMKSGGRLGLYLTNLTALDQKLERLARAALGKKLTYHTSSIGKGVKYAMADEELWVWQFDPALLIREMERLGFRLVIRRAGEFSEIQRRTSGALRNVLLHLNNLAYAVRAPAALATGNIYVFERL